MSSHLSIFKNSTALITGASSGIGKAYAQKLASLGIHLILTARSEQKLNELANELEKKYNIQVEVIGLDLAQPHAAARESHHADRKGLFRPARRRASP